MKILIAMLLGCTSAFAAAPVSNVPTAASTYDLNRTTAAAYKHSLGTKVKEAHTTAVGVYNFSATGGAVGTHSVGITLPAKAIIRNVFTDEVTNVTTSASGTLSFVVIPGNGSTTVLKSDLAAASWSGIQAGVPDNTVSKMIKPTAASSVLALIKTGALTAGKVKVFVDYVISE